VKWLDCLQLVLILVAISALILAGQLALLWAFTKPLDRGPRRIVDVNNRGHTRFVMPGQPAKRNGLRQSATRSRAPAR
jgi:hypothetical protein